MKKYFKAKILISIILLISASFFIIHIVQAVTAEPGSDLDPVITQSYVDAKINDLTTKINDLTTKNNDLTTKNNDLTAKIITSNVSISDLSNQIVLLKSQNKFAVVQVPANKQVICGASTELILRNGGKASTIASIEGGISNLISGVDLKMGENVPENQLILIPRDDGRGLKTITECFILIKGEYYIK